MESDHRVRSCITNRNFITCNVCVGLTQARPNHKEMTTRIHNNFAYTDNSLRLA